MINLHLGHPWMKRTVQETPSHKELYETIIGRTRQQYDNPEENLTHHEKTT